MGEGKASTLGVVAAVTGMPIAGVVGVVTSRAVSNVRRAVAVGMTATEGVVSPVLAPPNIWVAAHVTTAQDPNTVAVVVGATLWVPSVIGVVGSIPAGRDPNAILSTLGVCTGGAKKSVGTRTWAEIELLLSARLAAGELGSRRDLVAVGLEHIEREWTSHGCRGVGKRRSNRSAEGGATLLSVTWARRVTGRLRSLSVGQGARIRVEVLAMGWPN